MNTIRTDEHEAKILGKLARGWSVTAACKAAQIGRRTYYDWRAIDEEFAARCDDALEMGTDLLEDSTTRQALAGNTSLMVLLLKARRPLKYRDRLLAEHTGDEGGPLKIVIERVSKAVRLGEEDEMEG